MPKKKVNPFKLWSMKKERYNERNREDRISIALYRQTRRMEKNILGTGFRGKEIMDNETLSKL